MLKPNSYPRINCPICRRLFATTVEELPTNILLIQMLDALPTPVKTIEHKIEKLNLGDDVSDDDDSSASAVDGTCASNVSYVR